MNRWFRQFRLLPRQPILFLFGFLFGLAGLWTISLGTGSPVGPSWGQAAPSATLQFPPSQIHSLPEPLEKWQDSTQQGDYFDAIEATPVGYLIWSEFPVQVYIQPAAETDLSGRSQAWYAAVQQAVQEWQAYLPLAMVEIADRADITILRSAPSLQAPDPLPSAGDQPQTLIDRLPRVRSAETRYELLIRRSPNQLATLIHRFTIQLTPNQIESYTLATARHELGHALGIWGHSPLATDALYFSQVRSSPPISIRDINTLKRIYQQPTQLGWPLPE